MTIVAGAITLPAFVGLILLGVTCCTAQQEASNTAATQATASACANQCMFGGTCMTCTNAGNCVECKCRQAYFGALCENTLTRIDGVISFDLVNATLGATNTSAVEQLLRNIINTNYTIAVSPAARDGSKVTIDFSAYLQRPPSWLSRTDAHTLLTPIRTELSTTASVRAVFAWSMAGQITFADASLDVDECASNWDNCNDKATCTNSNTGFQCVCQTGYEGDGVTCTAITCNLNDALSTPGSATRTVKYGNGTVIAIPGQILPFGTTVDFTCVDNYILEDAATGNTVSVISSCKSGGWTGSAVTCSLDLEFRIAIGSAVASGLIVIIVIGCFVTSYCVKKERAAKARKAGSSDVNSFDNNMFDDV